MIVLKCKNVDIRKIGIFNRQTEIRDRKNPFEFYNIFYILCDLTKVGIIWQ